MKVIAIGRNSSHAFTLDHSSVSRDHAELREDSGVITLTDLESTNGTYLLDSNNQKIRITRVNVSRKDIVFFGECGPFTVRDILNAADGLTEVVRIEHLTPGDKISEGSFTDPGLSGEKKTLYQMWFGHHEGGHTVSLLRQSSQMNKLVRQYHFLMACLIGIAGYGIIFFSYPFLSEFVRSVFFGNKDSFTWSFQMFMWAPFFLGIHLLIQRYSFHRSTRAYTDRTVFPVKETTILNNKHFMMMLDMVRPYVHMLPALAPRIVQQVVLKYQASKSAEQASSMLNNILELTRQKLDVSYSTLRYIAWLIPSLGFMGTVYGISITVSEVGHANPDDPGLLSAIASNLAVAFDTTLLALVQSSILVYLTSVVQGKEEDSINNIGEYVLENIINRLE